ncbi:hypothetical protein [Pelagibacterium luteolum]|uniref:Uncharacterized protein n=1 Tax=Pelagibacterium luteolum TaxID=440168 RepID=A0A1G7TJZ5_9HYPH|nr:hypothetical protein [Pelagibacterium luteolum]SDG35531.1 hypothetical protein SAMN04487974_102172 [Pelagibacterium luteolum]
MPTTAEHTPGEWRYSINYGPEDEANYANVYDGEGQYVSNLKIHHAIAVVKAMNSADEMLVALQATELVLSQEGREGTLLLMGVRAAIAKAEGKP